MKGLASLPSVIEYSLVHFHLEFLERIQLPIERLLRLRRDLSTAGRQVLGDRFPALFDPSLPTDPVALRRHQRPGPPFVLRLSPQQAGAYDVGDRLSLTVLFWGAGIQMLGEFALVLQRMGQIGLHRGEGNFELVEIEAVDAGDNSHRIWSGGAFAGLSPPVNDLRWWLEAFAEVDAIVLEFVTPARLISRSRPLFRVDFQQMFPFVLRRVSSIFYFHCGAEIFGEVSALLSAVEHVVEVDNRLSWQDWRTLEGSDHSQELGGITGSIVLGGDSLQGLLWILRAGSLMNLGKGSSYGGGSYRLMGR